MTRFEDRRTSFGSAADAYERGRPTYPAAAIAACLPDGARHALDLGAGTGKLTRGLLAQGLEVVAAEPIAEMRALIPPEAEAIDATAEQIPLEDASVDAVLAGQAFHWFDRERALPEIARVLRPGGVVGLMWNLFDDRVDWVRAVCDAFDAEDRSSSRSLQQPWSGRDDLADPESVSVEHSLPTTADELVDNIASRSVVILRADDQREATLAAVRAALPGESFEVPYRCQVWRAVAWPSYP